MTTPRPCDRVHDDDTAMTTPDRTIQPPIRIVVHGRSRVLELEYSDGAGFRLPFELLRVYSPSAEVRGHGPGQEVLQVGKREVGIEEIDPVGNYAIRPRFSDGHDTGIYAWDYRLWEDYLRRLEGAGASRDPAAPVAPPPVGATAISRPRD